VTVPACRPIGPLTAGIDRPVVSEPLAAFGVVGVIYLVVN
jgi:hypothetical protein